MIPTMSETFVPGIPDTISLIQPTSEADFDQIESHLRNQRQPWIGCLRSARRDLKIALQELGFLELQGSQRAEAMAGESMPHGRVLIFSRLKSTDALLRKMSRFGEELCCMLDIWGLRVVVPDVGSLGLVAAFVKRHWEDPPGRQLLLRRGELDFPPVRDYREATHQGRSAATSRAYDQAVHINRLAPFGGVVEIQVLTHDLFMRAFRTQEREETHRRFAHRRTVILAAKT
jgi:hypothetical protein